ncbi:glycosyltransferase family 61 protein [Geminocystis herdmanii]|uniref:glycosyltransferase family 61 protein n=1 Tax=Geminocystis herdmanii TaxID=669359 RepID=UPI000349DC88|nr:glycosyltransferase family 61 protein [Geminocystis herdmanii]
MNLKNIQYLSVIGAGLFLSAGVTSVEASSIKKDKTSNSDTKTLISQLEGHDTYNGGEQIEWGDYTLGRVIGKSGSILFIRTESGAVFHADGGFCPGSDVLVHQAENGRYHLVDKAHPQWISRLKSKYGWKRVETSSALIKLLELANINFQDIDYFLVDNRTNFQQETLAIFGIPSHKILPLSFPLHIQATNLIVPSFPGSIAWMPSWSCQYLKDKILGEKAIVKNPQKKIYISRVRSSNRRIINEIEVINLLLKYGFEIIHLELLTVAKQAELLSQAKIVISPHGSGLSNLVFCQPNTKVIEIFAPNYVYPCYWLVSNLVNLDYYYLTGEIMGSKHFHQLLYPDCRFEDIYLNCQDLQQLLTTIDN